ncbi:MAG: hypothetical protein QXH51_07925 [Candidatus Bathyarchaeia archaeon]
MIGLVLVGFIWGLAILLAIAGSALIYFASGRKSHPLQVFKTLGGWLASLRHPLVIVTVILAAIGIYCFTVAPQVSIYTVLTGYRYRLFENVVWKFISGSYVPIKEYELWEFPVYTTLVDRWLDPVAVIAGIYFIVAALVVALIGLVKSNNNLYQVR